MKIRWLFVEVEDQNIFSKVGVAKFCASLDTKKVGSSKITNTKESLRTACKESLKRGFV